MISLRGKNKAHVLASLYNASKPQGLGFLNYTPGRMTVKNAQKYIDTNGLTFDYLQGRVLKIDLSGDEFDPWLYDRDNGQGAAAIATDSTN